MTLAPVKPVYLAMQNGQPAVAVTAVRGLSWTPPHQQFLRPAAEAMHLAGAEEAKRLIVSFALPSAAIQEKMADTIERTEPHHLQFAAYLLRTEDRRWSPLFQSPADILQEVRLLLVENFIEKPVAPAFPLDDSELLETTRAFQELRRSLSERPKTARATYVKRFQDLPTDDYHYFELYAQGTADHNFLLALFVFDEIPPRPVSSPDHFVTVVQGMIRYFHGTVFDVLSASWANDQIVFGPSQPHRKLRTAILSYLNVAAEYPEDW